MRLKNWPQLPGAGRTRAGHHYGSHTPTSPEAVLLGKMAYHTKQIRRQCSNIKAPLYTKLTLMDCGISNTNLLGSSSSGHRSLVGYLPQVKNSKNCSTGYYSFFRSHNFFIMEKWPVSEELYVKVETLKKVRFHKVKLLKFKTFNFELKFLWNWSFFHYEKFMRFKKRPE